MIVMLLLTFVLINAYIRMHTITLIFYIFCSTRSRFTTCIDEFFLDCIATIDVPSTPICPEGLNANVEGCPGVGTGNLNADLLSDFTTLQVITSPNFGNPSYIGNSVSR